MTYKLTKGEDGKVYLITENGKMYLLESVLHNRQFLRDMDELREKYTRRAVWRLSRFVSLDDEGQDEHYREYGDDCLGVRRMLDFLDGEERNPLRRGVPKCVRAKRAAFKIARALGLARTRNVARFLAAVWENGNERRLLTMADFGLSEDGYYKRLRRYLAILGWGCGHC